MREGQSEKGKELDRDRMRGQKSERGTVREGQSKRGTECEKGKV